MNMIEDAPSHSNPQDQEEGQLKFDFYNQEETDREETDIQAIGRYDYGSSVDTEEHGY